jgi:uncharacterized protein YbjT (DUF2867 family)
MDNPIVVFGATGNMGGAALRALVKRDVPVRATTRDPAGPAAAALRELGAEVVRADLDDPKSVRAALEGADRVFSVQSWMHVGVDGEIRQGKALADVCAAEGVRHVVYGSAGTGESDTGVAHFDAKAEVESHMRALELPHTIVRPTPFMELMTDPAFYPQVGVWNGERKVVGDERPIPWVAVKDIGEAIANAFVDPDRWIGQDVTLVSDVKSLGEARSLYVEALGRKPPVWPLPLWLVARLAGKDLVDMWRWMVGYLDGLGRDGLERMHRASRALVPEPTPMASFFRALS